MQKVMNKERIFMPDLGTFIFKYVGASVELNGEKDLGHANFYLSIKGNCYFNGHYLERPVVALNDIVYVDLYLNLIQVLTKNQIPARIGESNAKTIFNLEKMFLLSKQEMDLNNLIYQDELKDIYQSILIAGGII